MKIKITCKTCASEFEDYASNHRSFCSRNCQNKVQIGRKREGKEFRCFFCNNSFYRCNSSSKRHVPMFCSARCCGVHRKQRELFKGSKHPRYGLKLSVEFRERLSRSHIGVQAGDKHPLWRGGITPINQAIRNSLQYKNWRTSIFKRDDFACQGCGERGGKLNADHIKSFAHYPELRFELSNGRTLCVPCHKKTPTYAGRVHKFNLV